MEAEGVKPNYIVADLYDASRIIEKEINETIKPDLIMPKAFRASGAPKR
jgi:hypothetical protein